MENQVLKIIDLHTAVAEPMEKGRGSKIKLVNTSLGTEALDVHLNRLVPGGPRGNLHKHSREWGNRLLPNQVDEYSSAFHDATAPPATAPPSTWMLRSALSNGASH